MHSLSNKREILEKGFTTIAKVYSDEEVEGLLELISKPDLLDAPIQETKDLFALRQFLKVNPEAIPIIFNHSLKAVISNLFGDDYHVAKSIYFDKPATSNWFVAYHQDLTISTTTKKEIEGFSGWTKKDEYYSVQPPQSILENNFTIRVHLDDTDENNGALIVIPGSHKQGVVRTDAADLTKEKEVTCSVPKGGIMIMRPLLFHASARTKNKSRRRVIHIEFSNSLLPEELQWAEQLQIP